MPDQYLPPRPASITDAQRAEYRARLGAWLNAGTLAQRGGPDWERLDVEESKAYDELIEWVEMNELNGTEFDPRGPELAPGTPERN